LTSWGPLSFSGRKEEKRRRMGWALRVPMHVDLTGPLCPLPRSVSWEPCPSKEVPHCPQIQTSNVFRVHKKRIPDKYCWMSPGRHTHANTKAEVSSPAPLSFRAPPPPRSPYGMGFPPQPH
jgi:hypothetical protein